MNRIVASYIINLFYSVLACWAFVEFYDFYIQFADVIKNESLPSKITMSLTPVVLIFIVAIILAYFKRLHKRNITNHHCDYILYYFPKRMNGRRILQIKHAAQHLYHYGLYYLVHSVY